MKMLLIRGVTWASWLCFICCITSCQKVPQHDAQKEAINASFSLLLNVIGELESAKLDQDMSKERFELRRIIARVVERKGSSFFRCEVQPDQWLQFNPDDEKWAKSNDAGTNVAIYNPINFSLGTGKFSVVIGITFEGKEVRLANVPSWKPFPVWEMDNRK